jgi:hypothetical protein
MFKSSYRLCVASNINVLIYFHTNTSTGFLLETRGTQDLASKLLLRYAKNRQIQQY